MTVADYTFVADTTQEIAMTSDLSPELPHEALVFVKLGDYSKEYSIEIDGEKYIYKSGDGQIPLVIQQVIAKVVGETLIQVSLLS